MENRGFDGRVPFERRLARFAPSSEEMALLSGMTSRKYLIAGGAELDPLRTGSDTAYLLHEGWACVYRQLKDGNRQIIDFRLPGDFMGLMMNGLDYTLVTVTDVIVSEVSTSKLVGAFRNSPMLAQGLLWTLSRDMAILTEHLVNLGQRDALSRTVHLLMELGYRLSQETNAVPESYDCPLTQKDLAEALGITHVHLNRILRYLRDHSLLSFNDHSVNLINIPVLRRIADFDAAYLESR